MAKTVQIILQQPTVTRKKKKKSKRTNFYCNVTQLPSTSHCWQMFDASLLVNGDQTVKQKGHKKLISKAGRLMFPKHAENSQNQLHNEC